jgi:hypothetical protein
MELAERWPHRADAALRTWAWANPVIAAAVRRQEAVWEGLMRSSMAKLMPDDPERCRLLTHMILALLAGMWQLQRDPDPDLIRAVHLEFLRSNVGIEQLPDGTFGLIGRMSVAMKKWFWRTFRDGATALLVRRRAGLGCGAGRGWHGRTSDA